MAELEEVSEVEQERIDAEVSTEAADLVVGIPVPSSTETLTVTIERFIASTAGLSKPVNAVLAYPSAGGEEVRRIAGSAGISGLRVMPYAVTSAVPGASWLPVADAYRPLFTLASSLRARACTVLSPPPEQLTAAWMRSLIEPVLEGEFDLAMPIYQAHEFEGLLNSGMIYPLSRALYGKRLRYPLAADFQISARMLAKLPAATTNTIRPANRFFWLGNEAAAAGLKICQMHLAGSPVSQAAGADLSTILTQVVGSLFDDMESRATLWQRSRISLELPTFGDAAPVIPASAPADPKRMVDAFQLGVRNLQEIWSLILPPVTMLEVKKLARRSTDDFHLPDELWVRIVYDFALAHRTRSINRAHLFGALTSLYLGWAASFIHEISVSGAQSLEHRIEVLARVYEADKPYLLARWRWPDRFNP